MDNSFEMFHDRIVEAIRTGEVICLFFPRLGKTLVIDLRHTLEVAPAVFVEDMVASPTERYQSLEQLRPQLPLPDPAEVRLAPWLGMVRSLEDSSIDAVLSARCRETGHPDAVEHYRAALRALLGMEQRLLRAIVRGEMSRTLWQRPQS